MLTFGKPCQPLANLVNHWQTMLIFGNPYRFAKVTTKVKRIDYQLDGLDYKSSPLPYSVKKLSFGKPARIAKARGKIVTKLLWF